MDLEGGPLATTEVAPPSSLPRSWVVTGTILGVVVIAMTTLFIYSGRPADLGTTSIQNAAADLAHQHANGDANTAAHTRPETIASSGGGTPAPSTPPPKTTTAAGQAGTTKPLSPPSTTTTTTVKKTQTN